MRISDPYAELAVKNQKYVKNCTELYLAKRQINQLGNFEAFVNLEVLWINDNAIEKLSQLDQCFRIKFLYAQNNQIRTLENSSVQFFKFLKELRLYNNKLQDLHTNLKILSTHNQYLEDLDLFGNPLAEEENYRLYVIKALPSLLVLDRHVVTEEERNKANKLKIPLSSSYGAAKEHKKSPSKSKQQQRQHALVTDSNIVTMAGQPVSGTVKLLIQDVNRIKRDRQKNKQQEETGQFTQSIPLVPQKTSTSRPQVKSTLSSIAQAAGMDEWELAGLKKKFSSLEMKKNSNTIRKEDLSQIVDYLLDRGFCLCYNNAQKEQQEDEKTLVFQVFSTCQEISWKLFLETFHLTETGSSSSTTSPPNSSFNNNNNNSYSNISSSSGSNSSNNLRWQRMDLVTLTQRAEGFFEQASTLQKRAFTLSDTDDRKQRFLAQAHEFSQKAYHLEAIGEEIKERQSKNATKQQQPSSTSNLALVGQLCVSSPSAFSHQSHGGNTQYFTTMFSPLKEYSKGVEILEQQEEETFRQNTLKDPSLFSKYRLNEPDFQEYLKKKKNSIRKSSFPFLVQVFSSTAKSTTMKKKHLTFNKIFQICKGIFSIFIT